MKTSAEQNKIILLGVLIAVLAITIYMQFFSSIPPAVTRRVIPAAPLSPAASQSIAQSARVPAKPDVRVRRQSFRLQFDPDAAAESLDPMTVDPTLRTDLLANVRAVEFTGVERNIFQFG